MSRGVKATAEKIKRKTVIKQICNNKGNLKAEQSEGERVRERESWGGKEGSRVEQNWNRMHTSTQILYARPLPLPFPPHPLSLPAWLVKPTRDCRLRYQQSTRCLCVSRFLYVSLSVSRSPPLSRTACSSRIFNGSFVLCHPSNVALTSSPSALPAWSSSPDKLFHFPHTWRG